MLRWIKRIQWRFFALLFYIGQCAFTQTPEVREKSISAQHTISVTIGGNFIVTGSFSALPTERVDQFVTRMYSFGLNQISELGKMQYEEEKELLSILRNTTRKYPKRGILLKRSNGEKITVDLEKFRLTGDFVYNPYLRNDDVLIFPSRDTNDVIVVDGAVNKPTEFEYCEGDKLEDALIFAHGINPLYDKDIRVEIYRLTGDGHLDTIYVLPINTNFNLQRGDRIRFVSNQLRRKNYRAYVDGEVYQPGWVFLPVSGLPLSQVIALAGGIREEADLSNAEIIHGWGGNQPKLQLQRQEHENIEKLMMQRMSIVSDEDTVSFFVDNIIRLKRGSIVTDFKYIQSEKVPSQEIIVKDGDYIYIPRKIDYVYVFGQVANYGFVQYIPGKDYQYYISKVGGLGETAKGDVYIIKNRTRTWYLANEKKASIEPGDFIWVPKKPIRNFDYYLQRIGFIGSIITGIVTTIVLVIQITRK